MMISPEVWKLCVLETARLYLHGAPPEDIRKIVKHLNILLNTELIFQRDISRAMEVLESITTRVNAIYDHYYNTERYTGEYRLQIVQLQLQLFRLP
jgi:hypothetical protein